MTTLVTELSNLLNTDKKKYGTIVYVSSDRVTVSTRFGSVRAARPTGVWKVGDRVVLDSRGQISSKRTSVPVPKYVV